MAEAQPNSVFKKINDVVISEQSFVPEGQKEAIKYKRLIIAVEFDGVIEELEFVPSDSQGKLAYRILALADDVN